MSCMSLEIRKVKANRIILSVREWNIKNVWKLKYFLFNLLNVKRERGRNMGAISG